MKLQKEEEWINNHIVEHDKLKVPENFDITAPIHDPSQGHNVSGMPREYNNPQTQTFCDLIDIKNNRPPEAHTRKACILRERAYFYGNFSGTRDFIDGSRVVVCHGDCMRRVIH